MFVICSAHFERQVGCNTTGAGLRRNVCRRGFWQSQIDVSAGTLQIYFLHCATSNRSGDRAAGSFAANRALDFLQGKFTPAGAEIGIANEIADFNCPATRTGTQRSFALSKNDTAAPRFDFRGSIAIVELDLATAASRENWTAQVRKSKIASTAVGPKISHQLASGNVSSTCIQVCGKILWHPDGVAPICSGVMKPVVPRLFRCSRTHGDDVAFGGNGGRRCSQIFLLLRFIAEID